MIAPAGWAAFAALGLYLALFGLGTLRLRTAGQRVWLFPGAKGADRLAALGFRAGFTLAVLGPLLWRAVPALHKADPLWRDLPPTGLGAVLAALLAWAGAGLALVAQSGMGASWRVGVAQGAAGQLVTGGLFSLSRNPTFLGQVLLLLGLALALPALPTLIGLLLVLAAANLQIRSEERLMLAAHGAAYAAYQRRVPRWIGLPRR